MEFYYHGIEKDVLVVSADGGLNLATSRQFVESVEQLVDNGLRKILVDCEALTYISSFGVGVLLHLHHRLKKHGGDVKVCNVKGMIMKVLKLTRLDEIFDVYPDLERAMLAFRPAKPGDTAEPA